MYKNNGFNVDDTTSALIGIDYSHHEVHEGSSFVVNDLQNVNTTSMQWMITTPDSLKYAHMLFNLECNGEMDVLITEGADKTGTNALAEINRRRVGTPPAATVVAHRVVSGGTTDGAVTILSRRGGATAAGSRTVSPGASRGDNEFVLKPNTKYIITVTTYADSWVTFAADWYEHENIT
jgi:hypothetical protein